MGRYAAWRLMAEHGGPEKVPAEARRRCLRGEADPVQTWDVAEQHSTGEWGWHPAPAEGRRWLTKERVGLCRRGAAPRVECLMPEPLTICGHHDARTIEQLERCLAAEEGARGVLCADGHVGYSQPIGGAVAYREHISPSGVGYDIGWGNKAVRTNLRVEDGRDPRQPGAPVHEGDAGTAAVSMRLATVLEQLEVSSGAIDVLPILEPLREMTGEISDWRTFPQLYANGELVGGCDIVEEMFASGELAEMLEVSQPAAASAQQDR